MKELRWYLVWLVLSEDYSRLRLNGANFIEEEFWTIADRKQIGKLDKKIEAVTKQWDGIEIHGGKVNGKLNITENGRCGGLSATSKLWKKYLDADLKNYFENHANIWEARRSQFNQLLLKVDVHACPNCVVNQQLKM